MAEQPGTIRLEHGAEQYLLFRLGEGVYAVPVASVNEIVLLPELMPIDERAPHFLGVLDLRGAIIPVIDLQRRLGRSDSSYSIDDYLLVLEHAGKQFSLVVNKTLGVHQATAQSEGPRAPTTAQAEACVSRIVTINDTIVMLLDLDKVIGSIDKPAADGTEAGSRASIAITSDADRDKLRQRAEHLRQREADRSTDQLAPFAVAEINGEFFGFNLQYVREFCEVRQITRVPCCPEHIVGNVNVRGDVLTLIDVRRELNLPPRGRTIGSKIIVARTEELTVGVIVDELHGVVYQLPSGTDDESKGSSSADQTVVKGTAQFGDGMMCLLDLPVLLDLNRWVVNDEVPHV